MLNIKALLTKLCQSLIIETGTPTITATTGQLISASYAKYRHVVLLTIFYRNTTSVASNANVFAGTLTDTNLQPKMLTTGSSYYSNRAMAGTLTTSGAITIHNTSVGAIATGSTNYCSLSFFYITD